MAGQKAQGAGRKAQGKEQGAGREARGNEEGTRVKGRGDAGPSQSPAPCASSLAPSPLAPCTLRPAPCRIGVFVCDCGSNIAATVDVPAVVEDARKQAGVVHAEEGKWICSVDFLSRIQNAVKEQKLDRVVVACCTPRTHEPTFKATVKEAGLNPFLLEFVSIREQSSWVHKFDRPEATRVAKDLVKMGIAKARLLEPAECVRIPVGKEALVIGGGVSGMSAAVGLAEQGIKVVLVEKTDRLGGLLNGLDMLAPHTHSAEKLVSDLEQKVKGNPQIRLFLSTQVEDIKGYVGNYKVRISGQAEPFTISTIIAATGMEELRPSGFNYGAVPTVMTLLEFERKLKTGWNPGDVAFIGCVESRNEKRGCCNVGCMAGLQAASAVRTGFPQNKVGYFYPEISLEGTGVAAFEDAVRRHGLKLFRFADDAYPTVEKGAAGLIVTARDILSGPEVRFPANTVVLITGYKGTEEAPKLKGLLKVSSDNDGFFQEAHIKLRPLDFAAEGVYLCGCARSPKDVRTSIEEGMGAAMRALIPMNKGHVESEGIVSVIDLGNCSKCGLCAKVCPYNAIELVDKAPDVIQAICKGCGTCAAECPKDCIQIIHFTDEQIGAQVEEALKEDPGQKIVAFCCHWCALGAVDMAGVNRSEYPPNVRIIRVMCSGRVDAAWVRRALELKAAAVLIMGCEFPTCHYIDGNYKAEKRVERMIKSLGKKGLPADRIRTVWLSAADGPKFVATMKALAEELEL
ncbi:MAG: hydrogenase iron-sulfur subunit [Euryarchaeota archaeon]|nr:hydrogenase iron-sulfur subunit [Euryarchaeota archaeon]